MTFRRGAKFLAAAAAIAGLLGLGWWYFGSRGTPRLDVSRIVLVSIDTCRADHFGCYGYSGETTPHIDAVAREGVLFENCITPVPITLPAHLSMLAGSIPAYHGVHDNLDYHVDPSNVTLAEILKQQGYTTGAIISSLVLDSQFGLDQGFDTYNDRIQQEDATVATFERKGEKTSQLAVDWIEEHRDDRFFLFLHYFDPHHEYEAPPRFASKFPESPYAGEIAYVDHCIGLVIDKLKQLGLYESTLLVITGDHGEMLGEHGEETHAYFIYQSAIKVPLVLKLPGKHPPRRPRQLVGLIDIAPTICGLLGLEAPPGAMGQDLSPAFRRDEADGPERYLYCESMTPTKLGGNSLLSIVSDRWKYIQTTRPELYDLIEDPKESRNLLESQPEQAQQLADRLKEMLESQRRLVKDNRTQSDEQTRRGIGSLGYVGGRAREDFTFDQTKDDPKDLIEYHNLASLVYHLMMARQFEEARAPCELLLRKRPEYHTGYLHMAQIMMAIGSPEGAIQPLETLLQLDPDHPDALIALGNLRAEQGRLDEALVHFQKVLENQPDSSYLLGNIARVLALRGKPDEAVARYQEALQVDPDFFEARNALAGVLRNQGKLDEAIVQYREALRTHPKFVEAYFNLAQTLQAQGKLVEAIPHYTRAVELQPEQAEAHFHLAGALQAHGDLDQAIQHYEQAIRYQPFFALAEYNLGNLLLVRRDLDQAIKHLFRALELRTEFAAAHRSLGIAFQLQGKLREAELHSRKAVRIAPDDATAHFLLAGVLHAQDKWDEAIEHYRRTLAIQPDFADAQKKLDEALAAKNQSG